MPYINTVQEFGAALKQGPYAWPGGYPLYFVTSDGGSLSFATAWNARASIARAIIDDDKSGGWKVIGYDVNWEDADLTDDHTGNRIESAYAEDDAVGETDPIPKSYNKWYGRVHGVAPVVRGPKIIRDLDGLDGLVRGAIDIYVLGDVALDVLRDENVGIFHVELMEVESGARTDVFVVRSTSPCAAAYLAAKHFRLPSENLRVLAYDYGCTENLVATEANGQAPRGRSGPKIIRDLDGLPNGKAKGKRAIDFDLEQLKRGAAVEREHTSDPKIAQRIAMDHLVEDPRYYEKLAKIHLDGFKSRRRTS